MSIKTRIMEMERLVGIRHGGETVCICDDGDLADALALLAGGINVIALTGAADVARRLTAAGAHITLYFSGNVSPCLL